LREGQGVIVSVTRERARGKNPVLDLREIGHDGETPHLMGRRECDEELAAAKPADAETRAKLDAAIEDALARTAPIPGGGALTIEPTAALDAIDVDAGARVGSGDPERFALELNLAAAREAARQIRLRGLGGIIVIDFVSLRAKAHRKTLQDTMPDRFGVFDLARSQLRIPLHEQLQDSDNRLSAETLALNALRAIEREARAQTGRQIACTVAADVKAWLDAAEFSWRAELDNRIGMRWTLDAAPKDAPWPRDRIDARAL
jgi:Ribonuclease G/E